MANPTRRAIGLALLVVVSMLATSCASESADTTSAGPDGKEQSPDCSEFPPSLDLSRGRVSVVAQIADRNEFAKTIEAAPDFAFGGHFAPIGDDLEIIAGEQGRPPQGATFDYPDLWIPNTLLSAITDTELGPSDAVLLSIEPNPDTATHWVYEVAIARADGTIDFPGPCTDTMEAELRTYTAALGYDTEVEAFLRYDPETDPAATAPSPAEPNVPLPGVDRDGDGLSIEVTGATQSCADGDCAAPQR